MANTVRSILAAFLICAGLAWLVPAVLWATGFAGAPAGIARGLAFLLVLLASTHALICWGVAAVLMRQTKRTDDEIELAEWRKEGRRAAARGQSDGARQAASALAGMDRYGP